MRHCATKSCIMLVEGRKWCRPCADQRRLDQMRAWVRKNRDRKRELNRKWAAANPEKVRAYNLLYARRRKEAKEQEL